MRVICKSIPTLMFDLILEPTKRPITFRSPSYADRRMVAQMYAGKSAGYSMEELLAAYCLVKVDNLMVPEDWNQDPITRMDPWDLNEVVYYVEVFTSIALLDDKGRQSAIDAAKKLMSLGSSGMNTARAPGIQATTRPKQASGEPQPIA